MNPALIQRYQSGGDIYADILSQHGQAAADACAAAALSGDETQVNAALTLYTGTATPTVAVPLATDTTAGDLYTQLTTDPLAAPLADANAVLGNTFVSFLKNPYVLVTIALLVFFFLFDGLNILRGLVKKHTA